MYLICLIKKVRSSLIKKNCEMDADDLMMAALDAGAEDFAVKKRIALKS